MQSSGQSLILPSWSPPLASRPSASTASEATGLPCERTIGSPVKSLGQSLILPSEPPLASRPSASTASDVTLPPCLRTTGSPVSPWARA